jgi:hypothetical protein
MMMSDGDAGLAAQNSQETPISELPRFIAPR